jgi:hypothetical protein
MKPLLAHIYEPHRVTYPCYVQPKLNGIRALYQNGAFQSRDQLPFPTGLLAHLAEPLKKVFGPEIILDGELYVHGWPLQRINAAVTPVRQQPTEDTLKVEYHIFDQVKFNESFIQRIPCTLFQEEFEQGIRLVQTHYAMSQGEADSLYAGFVSFGYEGMMYRLGDCPYTVPKQVNQANYHGVLWNINHGNYFLSDKNNRCWHLLKRKDWQDDEFQCYAVQEGEGKLAGTLGALRCLVKDWKQKRLLGEPALFSVGSGLTDAERSHFWTNPPIGRLVKVKYLCLSSDGIPLNPTILAIL